MKYLLATDIGGTNCRFALYDQRNLAEAVLTREYRSAEFSSLEEALLTFQQDSQGYKIKAACVAITGEVAEEGFVSRGTWQVSPPAVRKLLAVPTVIINDFSAMAWASTYLESSHLLTLSQCQRSPRSARVVLGPGTGLGQGAAIPVSGGWQIIPTEGGKTNFAPINAIQDELLRWLRKNKKSSMITIEAVLSGEGLLNVYNFLSETKGIPVEIKPRKGAGIKITKAAVEQSDQLSQQAIAIFCDVLAVEAANLALKYLAKDGVYLCGAFVNNIAPILKQPHFFELFTKEGSMRPLMQKIPLYVITHPSPGLLGAAVVASRLVI